MNESNLIIEVFFLFGFQLKTIFRFSYKFERDIYSGHSDVWHHSTIIWESEKTAKCALEVVHRWLDRPYNHTTEHNYSCKLSKLVSNLFGVCISTEIFFCYTSPCHLFKYHLSLDRLLSEIQNPINTTRLKGIHTLCFCFVSFRFVLDVSQSDRFDYNPYHLWAQVMQRGHWKKTHTHTHVT